MTKNILITGISGFVGSHLAKYLKEIGEYNNLVGIVRDQIPSMWLDDVLDDITLVQGDIRDFGLMKRVIGHYHIDQIYHLAAAAQVKEAWRDPIGVFGSNVTGTVNLLEACRLINKDINVLIFNTDKIYGEKIGATEDNRWEASEPYATSKICQGYIGLTYTMTYAMKGIRMSCCCNIFGYDPFNSRLISNTVKSCIRGKNPEIWTNDKSIREYIYVEDVVDAITKIMSFIEDEDYDDTCNIYNIRTGYVYNQKDVVEKILKHFPELKAEYIEKDMQYQVQEESMRSINWTWKPRFSFEEGIKETIDLFNFYEDDWNKI